ncbi:MAG: NAD(P)/FAD-dependent oxidoreductase [Chloroflexota bacterium]
MTSRKKIVIVGAGHNALVCACYLAKAGHDVTVYERRSRVGGAVNTEPMWGDPGSNGASRSTDSEIGGSLTSRSASENGVNHEYLVDTCSVMHILIHKTPVIQELELSRFGLEYMQMDPWGFAPFPDDSSIVFHRDLDRTCQSIAAISERDAEAYRDFVKKWDHFNRGIFELFAEAPTPGATMGKIVGRTAMEQIRAGGKSDPSMGGLELLRKVLGNYGRMLDETFTSPQVKAAMAWMAAQSGPPPSEVGGGALVGAHSLYHDVGATHPRGGSGMLSLALARCLEHHGGTVRCNAPVKRIRMSGDSVQGIELEGGERIAADIVVSGAHVQTTLLDLVGRDCLPVGLLPKVKALRTGNGIGMTLRCAIDELPDYRAYPTPDPSKLSTEDAVTRSTGVTPNIHASMQLICPSVDYLQRAYDDSQRGYPARRPALVAMTPSSVDRSIVPEGKHSLYIWAQYHPYDMADGASWDDIREREADRLLETLAEYAPNVTTAVTHRYIQTPLDLERNVGLLRGNIMHVDMSLDQMFMFRPLPELSSYKTPIAGLYLTGASTHPGGGVSGASGRSAATAVLADLQQRRLNWRGVALGGAAIAGGLAIRRRRRRPTS